MCMRRRVDIIKEDGIFKFKPYDFDDFNIFHDERTNAETLRVAAWTIKSVGDRIMIHCSSKSQYKKRTFKLKNQEGTLFLYNRANAWYWNFRDKELQSIMDTIQVDAIRDTNDPVIIETVLAKDDEGNYIPTKYGEQSTARYYGNNVKFSISSDFAYDGVYIATVKFTYTGFLIVETAGYRTLYTKLDIKTLFRGLNDNIRLKDIEGCGLNDKTV